MFSSGSLSWWSGTDHLSSLNTCETGPTQLLPGSNLWTELLTLRNKSH